MSAYGRSGGGGRGAWGVLKGPGLEKCPKCGYDLRGLMQGVKCPECGTDTARLEAMAPRMGRESPLGAAPTGYLALLGLGFLLSGVGWAAWSLRSLMWLIGMGSDDPRDFIVFAGPMAVAWGIGQWLITMPRPEGTMTGAAWRRHTEWSTLRWMVRVSSVLGCAAVALTWWRLSGGPVIAVALWGVVTAFASATSCWYMARVVDWAPDDGLAWRFRACAWAIGVGALSLGVFMGPAWIGSMAIVWMAGSLMIMYGIGALASALFQLQAANTVRWAIRNMHELRAREERAFAKAERERRHGEAERAAMEAVSPERVRLMDEVESRHRAMAEAAPNVPDGPMPGHPPIIERATGDAYGLEGEGSPEVLRRG